MAATRVPVNPSVLRWAREVSGLEVERAATKIGGVKPERITEWEAGERRPTMPQLRNLSRVYGRTPAFFLMREVPQDDFPVIPDYRSKSADTPLSYELRRELRQCMKRRTSLIELEGGAEPWGLTGVPSLRPRETAEWVRNQLGITLEHQRKSKDNYDMLAIWIQALERQGVFVFQSSKFPLEEARGVSLYFSELPIILLNSKDAPAGKIFTIFHELFHLLRGNGGLCYIEVDIEEERLCNQFAGDLLMPLDEIIAQETSRPGLDMVRHLSKIYRVSELAMAIRLFQQGMIKQDLVNQVKASIESSVSNKEDKVIRIPHHIIRLRDIGRRYASAVFDAYQRDEITFAHTSRLIGAKTIHLSKMQDVLVSKEESRL